MSTPNLNVCKCVEYLRSIGADVTDEMALSWSDSERVHRYLRRMSKGVIEGRSVACENHHRFDYVVDRRKRKRPKNGHSKCPECAAEWRYFGLRWTEGRDGSVRVFSELEDGEWKSIYDIVAAEKAAQWPK